MHGNLGYSKSEEQYPYLEDGDYSGLWSAYYVNILFEEGGRSPDIKMTDGVRGINCPCEIIVQNGWIYAK